MTIRTLSLRAALTAGAAIFIATGAASAAGLYGPFPVTVKGYEGDKTDSTSYSGQIARHVLHDSLKKLASSGGGDGAAAAREKMRAYFHGSDADLPILAPATKGDFKIKQTTVGAISKGKNISGKFYDGAMPAWPGGMTGRQVLEHMIDRAALAEGGFDAEAGHDYAQLISKFTLGAMAYSQAVDNYLDEGLRADKKPNDQPYKKGAHYTGKEHVWDEAFGYFGAAIHSAGLTPEENYGIAKRKDLTIADANQDGVIDLKTEMVFGPAYYAAGADKSGKTAYMTTIMTAFIEGRELIASAKGAALSDAQRAALKAHAAVIAENWEKVLAEAAFKYAGSVYADIAKIEAAEGEAQAKAYRAYVKHWSELKGFAMALQSGKNNLGATAVKLNQLIGYGPVTMDNRYVTGVNEDGSFKLDRRRTWADYQHQMLKVQALLGDVFGVKARANDRTGELAALSQKLGDQMGAETD